MAPSSPILSPSRSPLSGGRVNGDNASVNERTALQSGMLGERKDSGVRKDSLTREKKGKMPVLSHLLNVGNGTVLSLAADEKYVYAGCQSADNEITVFSRSSLQPLYRLLGHQGSVLALLIVEEKKWLVSSSSESDMFWGLA